MTEKESRKKILVLTDWYEPGYKAGGPIQSVKNFVAGMFDLYEISVLTSSHDLGAKKPYEGIPENQWVTRQPGIQVYYAKPGILNLRKMESLIESVNPDFIYLNSMYSYRFSILPMMLRWRKKNNVRLILSPRGMLRESAIQYKSAKKKFFIRLLNLSHLPASIQFHATDDQEKKDILRYFPRAATATLISNFSAALPEKLTTIAKQPGKLRCVYISRILPIKNILFFLEVLKKVPEDLSLIFSIYGDIEDEKYWKETQEMIATMPAHIQIGYGGGLPHSEVKDALEKNHLFVLPTLGENFGHAIFESWSAGRPALISDRTPWRHLKKHLTGWDLSLDAPASWLHALIEAGEWDQEAFDSWCRNSREFAEKHSTQFNLKQEYIKLFS